MKIVICLTAVLWVVIAGCAATTPPLAYRELTDRMAAAPADPRYEDARANLKLANDALAKNDAAACERFSKLGVVEAKIADAQVMQSDLIASIETESKRTQQLKADMSLWQSKVDAVLADVARQQMRSHIEAVIDRETREAAAAEELQSQMGDIDDEELNAARKRVALELIAMASLRNDIATLLATIGAVMPEQLTGLEGSVELMKRAFDDDDMASVYRYGERNLSLFTNCLDDAWLISGDDFDESMQSLKKELSTVFASLQTEADVGYVIPLSQLGPARDGALNQMTQSVLLNAVKVLSSTPNVALIAVVSGGAGTEKSRQKTATVASAIRQMLSAHIQDNHRFTVVVVDFERPLRALTGRGLQGALLFFPVPEK